MDYKVEDVRPEVHHRKPGVRRLWKETVWPKRKMRLLRIVVNGRN